MTWTQIGVMVWVNVAAFLMMALSWDEEVTQQWRDAFATGKRDGLPTWGMYLVATTLFYILVMSWPALLLWIIHEIRSGKR